MHTFKEVKGGISLSVFNIFVIIFNSCRVEMVYFCVLFSVMSLLN